MFTVNFSKPNYNCPDRTAANLVIDSTVSTNNDIRLQVTTSRNLLPGYVCSASGTVDPRMGP